MGWAHDDTLRAQGAREALDAASKPLDPALRMSLTTAPNAFIFGSVIANHIKKAEDELALCQEQQAERWEELRDLKQRNRLLAALLLHDFDGRRRLWSASAIERIVEAVEGKDILLRRDAASGDLHLRTAPKGDPEPWERL